MRFEKGNEIELSVTQVDIPHTYAEAMQSPYAKKRKEAIRREIRSHYINHTWETLRLPDGVKVVGCKWVFAVKRDENGNITLLKARLVAHGFTQKFGVDFKETYSPVASLNSIRLLLALCCQRKFKVKQFDVETAFLNGKLEENVYIRPSEGNQINPGMVCKLKKSIYGLRQAAAVWYKTIREVMVSIGFAPCVSDSCMFFKRGDSPVYVVLYVDDLLWLRE
ncbi:TPA: hypothetical protein N0F65_011107 [Lagenidium giganteum]|uniref:Reverse transcriptase Ty1/copia-type domain-containing protein n=1 Tax=Lagenidium giganteum TaxID=4803 RepID=A0AAV2ZIE5_9STRA|nr:TPA: hypothetical protein N0F65_011107 [Lagenidium giganteum]